MHNPAFEEYYTVQGIIPNGEWDKFLECLRKPLPITFRINGSGKFANELREKLESDFFSHFEAGAIVLDGEEVQPPRPLPWYPSKLAWHMDFSRGQLRKLPWLAGIHEFMKAANEAGSITRQEAVSMVPPLLLDVQPHHKVLDMCAAPGSKTFQLLEALHASGADSDSLTPPGFVVANDADLQRCNLLTHQTKRMCSPSLMVTNHSGEGFPQISPAALLAALAARSGGAAAADGAAAAAARLGPFGMALLEGAAAPGASLAYDRILCDVPCSGDGTMRKAPDIWRRWNVHNGNGLHAMQLKIALQAARLLAVGGRLVYSTCTFNPVENEAVVSELLLRCKGALQLVDVSDRLPELRRNAGVRRWSVKDRHQWYESWEAAEAACYKLDPTMFCTPEKAALPLERCVRILPHQQDTGGFFVAVLEKVAPLGPLPDPSLAHRLARNVEGGKADGVLPLDGARRAAEYACEAAERAIAALEAGDAAAVEAAASSAAAAVAKVQLAQEAQRAARGIGSSRTARHNKKLRQQGSAGGAGPSGEAGAAGEPDAANGQGGSGAAEEAAEHGGEGGTAMDVDLEANPSGPVAADGGAGGGDDDVSDDGDGGGGGGDGVPDGDAGSGGSEDGDGAGRGEAAEAGSGDEGGKAGEAGGAKGPSWARGSGGRGRADGGGRFRGIDPILPVEDPAVLQMLSSFYGISDAFPLSSHLITRSLEATFPKRLYFVSDPLLALLLADCNEVLKIVSTGLKLFERHELRVGGTGAGGAGKCCYRIAQEGLPFLLPHIARQLLRLGVDDFVRLLQERNIPLLVDASRPRGDDGSGLAAAGGSGPAAAGGSGPTAAEGSCGDASTAAAPDATATAAVPAASEVRAGSSGAPQQPAASAQPHAQQQQQQQQQQQGGREGGRQKPLDTPGVVEQLRDVEPGGAVAVLDEADAARLGLATHGVSGALTANAPIAIAVWRTRASLGVLITKGESEQLLEKIRGAQQRSSGAAMGQ